MKYIAIIVICLFGIEVIWILLAFVPKDALIIIGWILLGLGSIAALIWAIDYLTNEDKIKERRDREYRNNLKN